MRINHVTLLILAGALFLAAPAAEAMADDLQMPARKAGQWEVTMSLGQGRPEMTTQMCLDANTDNAMMEAGLSLSKEICPEQSTTRDGETIVIDSSCQFGAMKTTSHIVISGDFQSHYTVQITGAVEGAPKGMPGKTEMTQTVHWVGADCSGGLKPGEMIMPGGMKIDATKLLQSMGGG